MAVVSFIVDVAIYNICMAARVQERASICEITQGWARVIPDPRQHAAK